MGISPAGADPTVFEPPPSEPDPVAADGGVGPASGPGGPAAPAAPAPAQGPAAPVDTFESAPAQPATRYGAAGPELEKRLDKNGDEVRAALANKDDPAKNFFEVATKSQERVDLLGKVIDKTPDGGRKTRLNG